MRTERIAVIGDLMLDKHIHCEIVGLSPEDDLTPKLRVISERTNPGGAANVAVNLKSLGCREIHLFGVIGVDLEGQELTEKLHNITTGGFLIKNETPTTTKTRYVTPRGRHVARIDREEIKEFDNDIIMQLRDKIHDSLPLDLIVVSDYAKGVITEKLMSLLLSLGTKIIVDPKGRNYQKYGKVYAITPNETEAIIANQHAAEYLIITKGSNGCELHKYRLGPFEKKFKVRKREVGDPTGCGDSFIAGLALALTRDKQIKEACGYALATGACAIDHEGAYAVTYKDVGQELASFDYFGKNDIESSGDIFC